MTHPLALRSCLNQVSMMDQTVQHGCGQLLVGEDGPPLVERQVGGDDQALLLVAVVDDAEQQLGSFTINRDDISPFIQNQQFGLEQIEDFRKLLWICF